MSSIISNQILIKDNIYPDYCSFYFNYSFINNIINLIEDENNILFSFIQNKFLFLLENLLNEYFPNHNYFLSLNHNYEIINYSKEGYLKMENTNQSENEYTILIGLNEIQLYDSGNTILWINENDLLTYEDINKDCMEFLKDLNILKYCNDDKVLHQLFIKKNISSYNKDILKEKLLYIRDLIIKYNHYPIYFKALNKGDVLLFKNSIFHSGYKFSNFDKDKKYLCLKLKMEIKHKIDKNYIIFNEDKLINKYDKFENWMIPFTIKNNVIPFQILIHIGSYNEKEFKFIYTRYFNFDNDFYNLDKEIILSKKLKLTLNDIYQDTKKKLNSRYREDLNHSYILERSKMKLGEINDLFYIYKNKDKIHLDLIDNYILNNHMILIKDLDEKDYLSYHEKVLNIWEEREGNPDPYEDLTFLNSKIYILWCFLNIK